MVSKYKIEPGYNYGDCHGPPYYKYGAAKCTEIKTIYKNLDCDTHVGGDNAPKCHNQMFGKCYAAMKRN